MYNINKTNINKFLIVDYKTQSEMYCNIYRIKNKVCVNLMLI